MSSIRRYGIALLSFTSLWAADDSLLWEPAKVVTVEPVSSPAKTPDLSCRSIPRGSIPPAKCRPSNLRAEKFWRVTVEVGNKRFVVRPYRAANVLEALNQDGVDYVDPHLTEASTVEVAISSAKMIRLRTDPGQGIPAMVESQEFLKTSAAIAPKAEVPPSSLPPQSAPRAAATVAATSLTKAGLSTKAAPTTKVVALENGDFRELEVAEFTTQDVSDGVVLYSFSGDASPIRSASNTPVFLLLSESDGAAGGNAELSRLQVAKGTRQLVFSVAKNRSASAVDIVMTPVSATVRKFSAKEPLAPGSYVVLLEHSSRGFLFDVR